MYFEFGDSPRECLFNLMNEGFYITVFQPLNGLVHKWKLESAYEKVVVTYIATTTNVTFHVEGQHKILLYHSPSH